MRVGVEVGRFADLIKGIAGDIAQAATDAMRATAPDTKRELREQITAAGLGQRLANTWRDRVYPQGRRSITPTGYIWSNAPDIVDSFVRGATIVPVNGSRFLAIPSDNVPKQRGRGKRRAMSPAEVEHEYNQDLIYLRGKKGRVLAFISRDRGMTKRGKVRAVRKGRRGHGEAGELVLMFTLVRSLRMPKLLDLDRPAQAWTRRYEADFTRRLEAL